MAKVVSIEYLGKEQTYDLEVDHPDHQFYLANGMLTSNSHAIAYSILSYQSAWLLTHYRDEWVTSYIDYCATEKGKLTGKEDPKTVAIREAMKLGYKLGKPDINISSLNYVVHLKDKVKYLIPSFLSMKGIGESAAEEILNLRRENEGYTDVYSLLLKKDGQWKHTKFNRSALAAIIQIEALESLDIVGQDKIFKNYKQLYNVVIENFDVIKRYFQRKKTTLQDVYNKIDELIEQAQTIDDWTVEEKKQFQLSIIGQYDISSGYDDEVFEQLEKNGVISIDQFFENPSKKGNLAWFFVQRASVGKTQNQATFLKVQAVGEENQQYTVFFWNASLTEKAFPQEGDLMVATLKINLEKGLISTNDSVVSSIVNRKVSLF